MIRQKQHQGRPPPDSLLEALRLELGSTGRAGVGSALALPLAINAVLNSVAFTVYTAALLRMQRDAQVVAPARDADPRRHFTAGCLAGVAHACVSTPTETVKTQVTWPAP